MSNVERWVQRVDGVARVKTDLNTGQASIWFKTGELPAMYAIWEKVKSIGYQPVKIVAGGQVYTGPKP